MSSITWHGLPSRTWMSPTGNRARKRELNAKKEHPFISEVQARFGQPLSSIFFDFLADEEKEELGLIPTLQGPEYSSLWVSPDDSSNNNIKFTTFEDTRFQKALTHQNILNIGETIENEQNLENDRKVTEATDYAVRETLKFLTKRKEDKENAQKSSTSLNDKSTSYDIEDESEPPVEEKLSSVGGPGEDNDQCENELSQNISQSSNNSNVDESKDHTQELESQLQQALIEREQYVMKKMNYQMLWESERQYEAYKSKIMESHKKWTTLYNRAKLSFEKELKTMRFEMEARQLADLIKIQEKKMLELKTLKEIMERHFYEVIDSQQIEIEKREKIIKDLIKLIDDREIALKNWELKVCDIMKEFQDLMKFIMLEAPNETEFLVDFEQILEETLRVPQPSPLPKCVPPIKIEMPDGLILEGIDHFLNQCDASIGKLYSTSVEVIRENNEFDIKFNKICTEIQFENMRLDQHVTYDTDKEQSEQDFKEETDNSRLSTILKILKRHPSFQRIVISTNITKK
ncbi:hypothetical protein LSTR_LSTR004588 [Laodelphax striatellus]|uniref:Uncharacterized protein n=1 Tax=Laodelphax striatellus TaxID=195883 RepID=A0A482WV49_LAOST|nr:hypothetical protein LSTR_LSTR004588 [Laodelphax striatellus]